MTPSKEIEVKGPASDGSFYITMDGPWQSEEDNAAYQKACEIFDQQKELYPYVALIRSSHWASEGYWVAIKEEEINYPDLILKYHS